MVRSIGYDPQKVRAAAQLAFYRKGFAETSLADLETATGLNRRQLYNGFGDKRDLFLQALHDFRESAGQRFLSPLEHDSADIDTIRSTLIGMVDIADTPIGRLGCMVCNTSREPIAKDPAVNTQVEHFFRRIESAYRNALQQAQKNSALASHNSPASLARFFFGIHVSLCVLGRAGEPTDVLRDIANEALARID